MSRDGFGSLVVAAAIWVFFFRSSDAAKAPARMKAAGPYRAGYVEPPTVVTDSSGRSIYTQGYGE